MTLVFLYGAPGVGKLTTADALATLTGFKNFHNHLSFDLVKAVFRFPTPSFLALLETIRLTTFEAAARENVPGLIFTFVYAPPHDDPFVKRTIDVMERHGGRVLFVRLVCDTAILEQRVARDDRKRYGKIATAEALRDLLARENLVTPIAFVRSFDVDNSALDASDVAERIVRHFSLPAAR